jgi:hypothetical protein
VTVMDEDIDPQVIGALLIGAAFASLVLIVGLHLDILSTSIETANPTTLANLIVLAGSWVIVNYGSYRILNYFSSNQ